MDADEIVEQELSVTGCPNRPVSAATQKVLFESFMRNGDSFHSGRGETVWVILEHCERNRIPYRVELARINGTHAGVRVARTDRPVAPMKEIELPGDWKPVSKEMLSDPLFHATGRDAEGNEFVFWNGGGDWLRETTIDDDYLEDLCFPVEWKSLATVDVIKEWIPEPIKQQATDFEP